MGYEGRDESISLLVFLDVVEEPVREFVEAFFEGRFRLRTSANFLER